MLTSEFICARLRRLATFYSAFNSDTAAEYAAFARLACSRIEDRERRLRFYRGVALGVCFTALAVTVAAIVGLARL